MFVIIAPIFLTCVTSKILECIIIELRTFRHYDVSPSKRFVLKTFRTQDVSPPGRFALKTFRTQDVSHPGRFATWTFRPQHI